MGVVKGEAERKERNCNNGEGIKKRRTDDEESSNVEGWTKEQELALQRAYLAVKPTPHFWKKVARMVPGKSAHDCFDKIHADQLTPPQPQLRSRTKKINSSPLLVSSSNLFNSMDSKLKRPSYSKKKSQHLARKTVRKLLEKHYEVNQNYEVDLFSVLEPTLNSSQEFQQSIIHSTPKHDQKPIFLKRCQERSSLHKKNIPQLSRVSGENLVSPPVLKQIKNKNLHEKYIDQLHSREAKRKAASTRAEKSCQSNKDRNSCLDQKMDTVKAAKNALIFDAIDAINHLQDLQNNATSNFSDADDDGGNCDEDEGDMEHRCSYFPFSSFNVSHGCSLSRSSFISNF